MPCYEPPPVHEVRLPEFLTAALCYATRDMSWDDLEGFPGLAEWRRRHEIIDGAADKYKMRIDYDRKYCGDITNGWAPLFMCQYLTATGERA